MRTTASPDYIGQISGQGPNRKMQSDCQIFIPFKATGTAAAGQFVDPDASSRRPCHTCRGSDAAGLTWKGYF